MPDERRKPCPCQPGKCVFEDGTVAAVFVLRDGFVVGEDPGPERYCKISAHDALKRKADFVDWLDKTAPMRTEMWRLAYNHTIEAARASSTADAKEGK